MCSVKQTCTVLVWGFLHFLMFYLSSFIWYFYKYVTLLIMGWCCLVSCFDFNALGRWICSDFLCSTTFLEVNLYAFLGRFSHFLMLYYHPYFGIYMSLRYYKLWVDFIWLQPIRMLYGRRHVFLASHIWMVMFIRFLEFGKPSILKALYRWCMLRCPHFQHVAGQDCGTIFICYVSLVFFFSLPFIPTCCWLVWICHFSR